MLNTSKYSENFRALFAELKRYLQLQKQHIALDTADKLITLLSAVAIATICLILGAMVLFFAMFALAYWIGQLTDSIAIGFLIISTIILLGIFIFYHKRNEWIIQPLARLIIAIFVNNSKDEADGHNSQQ